MIPIGGLGLLSSRLPFVSFRFETVALTQRRGSGGGNVQRGHVADGHREAVRMDDDLMAPSVFGNGQNHKATWVWSQGRGVADNNLFLAAAEVGDLWSHSQGRPGPEII